MRGSIVVVGIGPGPVDLMTPAAREAVEATDVIVGYTAYLRQVESLAPGVPREAGRMTQEVARVNRAVDLALEGRRVALVSGGDAGIYGMAGLAYEVARERGVDITIEVLPGVSALNAAAALLGAPLMHDFAVVSLSDRLTPLDDILRRVELAAQADFVLCLYNPKGRDRIEPFRLTCEVLARCRSPQTPAGVVRAAYRDGQRISIIPLAALHEAEIDMTTVVIVGNSRTYVHEGKMITPRGYGERYDLAGERGQGSDPPAGCQPQAKRL